MIDSRTHSKRRRTWARMGLPICVIVLAPALATAGEAPDLTPYLQRDDVIPKLEKGEYVSIKNAEFPKVFGDETVGDGEGTLIMFLVPASEKTAWDVIHDFNGHHAYMPHMKNSVLQESTGTNHRVRYTFDVLWIKTDAMMLGESLPEQQTLIWHVVPEGTDKRLKGLNIFWRIQEYEDGRTLMAYFQNIKHSTSINSLGAKLLASPKSSARAMREEVEARSRPTVADD